MDGDAGVQFLVLGSLEVRAGERLVTLGGAKPRLVLAVLLVHANTVVSADRLIDVLWGDAPPDSALTTVQKHVHRLRAAIDPGRAGADPSGRLVTRAPGYLLRVEADECDASRFERAVADARRLAESGASEAAAAGFGQALALWRGPALAEFADHDFARAEVARLDNLRAVAMEERVEVLLSAGRHAEVIGELEATTAAYPLRETPRAQLMLALYRCGRHAEALRAYEQFRRYLGEEVGLEPSAALVQLADAIVVQKPELSPVATRDAPAAATSAAATGLPSGVVTFLLTDVVGSTRLWQQAPEEMDEALERHDQLIASAVRSHHGAVLKSKGEGDSTMSVFARASDAVAAAVELQQQMSETRWPERMAIKVRVAVHTGEARERDGDYFGPTVNRAARLRNLASGGHVLLSHAIAALVRDCLPLDVCLVDVGHHPLSGFAQAEHTFAAVWPGVEIPVLGSEHRGANLPAPLSSFVGRQVEVATVTKILASSRLVTLSGAGGCGKTRLALEVAGHVANGFRDGVWFVDLAPLREGSRVADAFASALGLRELADRDAVSIVEDHTRDRELLLVIDNCEHLVEAAAGLITRLLQAGRRLKVLATSREALGVDGENCWRVPALAEPEAVELFLDRLTASGADGTLAEGDFGSVARICRALDGIPLALELAAARAGVLGLSEVASRLGDMVGLLASKRARGSDRHRTMEATIDWGYDTLDPPACAVLQQLSVFAGGWDLPAAVAMCGPHADDQIEELAGKSFVLVDPHGPAAQYRLLEPIRQYALAKLTGSGEYSQARDRHLAWFLGVAEELEPETEGPEGAGAQDRLERDLDNFRAALGWAAESGSADIGQRLVHALFPLWAFRSHYREGLAWSEAVLAIPGPPTGVRSAVARRAGLLAGNNLGEATLAARFQDDAVSTARSSGDRRHLGRALCTAGFNALVDNNPEAARALLEEGTALAHEVSDNQFAAEGQLALSSVAWRQGRYDEAKALAQLVIRDCAGRDLHHHAKALQELADIAQQQGAYQAARDHLHEAETLISALEGDQKFDLGICVLSQLAHLALSEGRTADARTACDAVREILEDLPDEARPFITAGLGWRAVADGDASGLALMEESVSSAKVRGEKYDLSYMLAILGAGRLATNNRVGAHPAYEEALQLAEEGGNPWDRANALEGLAACLVLCGEDSGETARLLLKAEALRKEIGGVRPPAYEWIANIARRSARPGLDSA